MQSINYKVITALSLFIILITGGVAYVNWNVEVFSPLTYVLYFFIYFFYITKVKQIVDNGTYSRELLILSFVPFLSAISLLVYGEESVTHSIRYFLEPSCLLIYFVLMYYNVGIKTIETTLLIWGIIISIVFIVQQINPDSAVFGVYNQRIMDLNGLTEQVSLRNDLYRYRLDSFFYLSYFCLFYAWVKLLEKLSLKWVILFSFYAIAIYLYLARQVLAIAIFTIIISSLYRNKNKKFIIPILALGYILYTMRVSLFGNLMESTTDDLSSDYIRYLTYNFFGSKIFDNPIVFAIGNGHMPQTEQFWAQKLSVYTSDIGIVGTFYYYGVFWCVSYIYLFYKIFKNRQTTPLYILMFFFAVLIDSIFIMPIERPSHMLFFCLCFYLAEQ